MTEFNRRFQVAPAQRGSAFLPCRSRDLERIFSLQFERSVNRDNTVSFQNLTLQIERVQWRATLAGCSVTAHQHLNGTLSLSHGPHCLGRYDPPVRPDPKGFYRAKQGKGNCPLPLQPHPQNQPNPIGEGTTMKPDISLATKTGHFNLLTTDRSKGGSTAHPLEGLTQISSSTQRPVQVAFHAICELGKFLFRNVENGAQRGGLPSPHHLGIARR